MNNLNEIDFMTVEQLKANNKWVLPWIAGKDLPHLIEQLGNNISGIEIGVCRGENIYYCLENCDNIKNIVAIDPYSPFIDWNGLDFTEEILDKFYNIAKENFKNFDNKVSLIKQKSEDACNSLIEQEYDYIFIDGEHTYEAVKRDLKNFYSKIKNGGLVSGHDYNLPGIPEGIRDFREEIKIQSTLRFCQNNVWYWNKE